MTATQKLEAALAGLKRMTATQHRTKYLEVFVEPSRSGNKNFRFERNPMLHRPVRADPADSAAVLRPVPES